MKAPFKVCWLSTEAVVCPSAKQLAYRGRPTPQSMSAWWSIENQILPFEISSNKASKSAPASSLNLASLLCLLSQASDVLFLDTSPISGPRLLMYLRSFFQRFPTAKSSKREQLWDFFVCKHSSHRSAPHSFANTRESYKPDTYSEYLPLYLRSKRIATQHNGSDSRSLKGLFIAAGGVPFRVLIPSLSWSLSVDWECI